MEKKKIKTSEQKPIQKKKAKLNSWAKYSSLSFQMIATIMICFFGGLKLDQYLQWQFPVFTLVLSLLGIFAALWIVLKDFLK